MEATRYKGRSRTPARASASRTVYVRGISCATETERHVASDEIRQSAIGELADGGRVALLRDRNGADARERVPPARKELCK